MRFRLRRRPSGAPAARSGQWTRTPSGTALVASAGRPLPRAAGVPPNVAAARPTPTGGPGWDLDRAVEDGPRPASAAGPRRRPPGAASSPHGERTGACDSRERGPRGSGGGTTAGFGSSASRDLSPELCEEPLSFVLPRELLGGPQGEGQGPPGHVTIASLEGRCSEVVLDHGAVRQLGGRFPEQR